MPERLATSSATRIIEHRLIPPRKPQTNGMVERFNGRIAEVLQTYRFDSTEDLATTLLRYADLYNHHIPQRALDHQTPVQALKQWQSSHPNLFHKTVYHLTGLDTGSLSTDQFEGALTDLMNFLVYMSEPSLLHRLTLGKYVLGFMILLTYLLYRLKKEFWKDVH